MALPLSVARAKISAMSTASRYDEVISLPRAVRFPVEMIPPPHFHPGKLETWPQVVGRLEYVDGRLLYMPPCRDFQQDTATDVVITIGEWVPAPRIRPGHERGGDAAPRSYPRRGCRGVEVGGFGRICRRVSPSPTGSGGRGRGGGRGRFGDRVAQEGRLVRRGRRRRRVDCLTAFSGSARGLGGGRKKALDPQQNSRAPISSGLRPRVSEFFVQLRSRR